MEEEEEGRVISSIEVLAKKNMSKRWTITLHD
jgi:hypothetical protein